MKAKSENHAFSKIVFVLLVLFSTTAFSQWTTSGTNIYNSNTGNVGIGTTTPAAKLHVTGFSLFSSTTTAPTNSAYIRGNSTWSTQTTPDYTWFGNNTTGIFNPANSVIGFSIAGVEAMRINASKFVGIGATPGTIFQVRTTPVDMGSFSLNNAVFFKSLNNNGGSTPAAAQPVLILGREGISGQAYANFAQFDLKRYTNSGTNAKTQLDIRLTDLANEANGSLAMSLRANGLVGIGTLNPSNTYSTSSVIIEKFHVNNGAVRLTGNNGAGGPMILWGNTEADTYSGVWGIEYISTTAYPSSTRRGLNFWKLNGSPGATWGDNFLFLADNNGNVGIKTDNPTADLTVNGIALIGDPATALPAGYKLYVQTGILTEKVKVAVVGTGNWSDYVFSADYKLRSIGELENYLLKHKHLPNIPSAEEVVKDGIDVATMDAKLLEKIEELSLYVIELNKKNIELTKRLNKLENK